MPKKKGRRSDGEGTIYFEKSRNKWHVAITDPEGNRIHERFTTQEEADAWRLSMAAKYRSGNYVVKQSVTLGEWILQFLNVFVKPNVRKKTLDGYIDTASHISEEFAAKELQKLTPLDVQSFINTLDASIYIKEKVGKFIRRVSKKAFALSVIEKDFTVGVEIPHPEKKEIEIFSAAELDKVFYTLATNNRLRHRYLFIALAVASGCRMGELLGLTPADITNDSIIIRRAVVESKGKVMVVPPKTKAGYRRITLPAPLITTLQFEASRRFTDDFIFKNQKGKPYRTSNVDKSWKTILKYAEVRYRKFHCLRHTHATMLLAAGVPVMEVAKRLGHSRPSHTLNLYGHAIPGYDKNLPDLVTQVFRLDKSPFAGSYLEAPTITQLSTPNETVLKPKQLFVNYVMKNKKLGV